MAHPLLLLNARRHIEEPGLYRPCISVRAHVFRGMAGKGEKRSPPVSSLCLGWYYIHWLLLPRTRRGSSTQGTLDPANGSGFSPSWSVHRNPGHPWRRPAAKGTWESGKIMVVVEFSFFCPLPQEHLDERPSRTCRRYIGVNPQGPATKSDPHRGF